jgi:hypothetical protein
MARRKKTSRRKSMSQKMYKMRGCNKSRKKYNYLGGSADINFAYPSNNIKTVPNPFLSYTGKGGSPSLSAAYPNPGPPSIGFNFLNPQMQNGGNCGSTCPLVPMLSGGSNHRNGCRCSTCKNTMNGGSSLVGNSWTPSIGGWPGVNGMGNYLELNKYPTDPQTAMIATGAQPPFSVGGKRRRKQRHKGGGTLSNFLAQDLLNVGRQFQYGVGSTYNALAGYSAPVSPMPWKDQLPNSANISAIRAAAI